jgi:hypothetical protein
MRTETVSSLVALLLLGPICPHTYFFSLTPSDLLAYDSGHTTSHKDCHFCSFRSMTPNCTSVEESDAYECTGHVQLRQVSHLNSHVTFALKMDFLIFST